MNLASALRMVAITNDLGTTLDERLTHALTSLQSRPTALLVRERSAPPQEIPTLLRALVAPCAEGNVLLIANATMVARTTNTDELLPNIGGVHFGISTASHMHDTRHNHPHLILGYSAHSADEAIAALANGAHYITLSPLFETPSKQGILPALGPDAFRAAISEIHRAHPHAPVVALGGIETAEHTRTARAAGACGVAAIRAASAGATGPAPAMRTIFDAD